MNNDKRIEIIKQLLMIDTAEWLEKIKKVVVDGICAESDQDDIDKKEYERWKREEKEKQPELPF